MGNCTISVTNTKRKGRGCVLNKIKSHLRDLDCLGLVGPDRRGFCPIQSFSVCPSSDWFNRQRSSFSRADSSHWTRHRGARDTFSFISKGANLPHAGASVWKEKMTHQTDCISDSEPAACCRGWTTLVQVQDFWSSCFVLLFPNCLFREAECWHLKINVYMFLMHTFKSLFKGALRLWPTWIALQ